MDEALYGTNELVVEDRRPLKNLRVDDEGAWDADDKANVIVSNARQSKCQSDDHAYNLHREETCNNDTDSSSSMIECIN